MAKIYTEDCTYILCEKNSYKSHMQNYESAVYSYFPDKEEVILGHKRPL